MRRALSVPSLLPGESSQVVESSQGGEIQAKASEHPELRRLPLESWEAKMAGFCRAQYWWGEGHTEKNHKNVHMVHTRYSVRQQAVRLYEEITWGQEKNHSKGLKVRVPRDPTRLGIMPGPSHQNGKFHNSLASVKESRGVLPQEWGQMSTALVPHKKPRGKPKRIKWSLSTLTTSENKVQEFF